METAFIYVVEDDESIRELILYALEAGGMESCGFEEALELKKAMEKRLPDLILLDIMLPGADGLEILTDIKSNARTVNIPVIMLTAKTAEYDKVRGLDLGADDYIGKPFGVMELLSRIRAVLRRSSPGEHAEILRCAGITMDTLRRVASVDDVPVALTFKEFELLAFLIRNVGIVLSREKIMERVWGFDYEGESRTVDMHVKSLRKKLGVCGIAISTVRGVGYKIGD